MSGVRSVLTDTLRAALGQLWTEPEDDADLPDWEALPGKLADALLSLSGVAVTQLPEPDDADGWHGEDWKVGHADPHDAVYVHVEDGFIFTDTIPAFAAALLAAFAGG